MKKNKKLLLLFAIILVIILVALLIVVQNKANKKREEEYNNLITKLCNISVELSETNPNVINIDKEEVGSFFNVPLKTISLLTLGKDNHIAMNLKNPKLSRNNKAVYFGDRMAMKLIVDNDKKVICKDMIDLGEDPKVILKGEKEITIKLGEKYVEPGYTASDKEDGDLTSRVLKNGIPNTNERGEYTIIYYLEDSTGNKTSEVRTINVK